MGTGPIAVLPVVISSIAVVISAVSAWVSIRQSRLARRTRLGQVIDELSKADVDASLNRPDGDAVDVEVWETAFNDRQEILARQAVQLFAGLRPTSRELTIVATTMELISDYPAARELHERSVVTAQQEGDLSRSVALERCGIFLFMAGDLAAGSRTLSEAAEALEGQHGDRALQRRFSCIAMRAVHHVRYGYEVDAADGLLEEARRLVGEVRLAEIRRGMTESLTGYRAELRDARRTGSRTTRDRPTR